MFVMKKLVAFFVVLCLVAIPFAACSAEADEKTTIRIGSLKGPTTMGIVKLMKDAEAGETENAYEFTMEATADAIAPLLLRGELDIALVPCNLASVLYAKSEGKVQVAAINTLGVLYVLEAGDEIHSVADLAGKTIYSTGKGNTPEMALNYVLKQNGLDPEKDVNVEFKSEATEVASSLLADAATLAVLPQPYVTAVLKQNENVRVALSLTEEWDKVSDGSAMITGVAVVRKAFADENPEAMEAFLSEYAASTDYVNANAEEAAAWIAELEIVAAAPIAQAAIPACNIVCITGEEMVQKVSGYLQALYDQNPEAVGGAVPDEAFYFVQ